MFYASESAAVQVILHWFINVALWEYYHVHCLNNSCISLCEMYKNGLWVSQIQQCSQYFFAAGFTSC